MENTVLIDSDPDKNFKTYLDVRDRNLIDKYKLIVNDNNTELFNKLITHAINIIKSESMIGKIIKLIINAMQILNKYELLNEILQIKSENFYEYIISVVCDELSDEDTSMNKIILQYFNHNTHYVLTAEQIYGMIRDDTNANNDELIIQYLDTHTDIIFTLGEQLDEQNPIFNYLVENKRIQISNNIADTLYYFIDWSPKMLEILFENQCFTKDFDFDHVFTKLLYYTLTICYNEHALLLIKTNLGVNDAARDMFTNYKKTLTICNDINIDTELMSFAIYKQVKDN